MGPEPKKQVFHARQARSYRLIGFIGYFALRPRLVAARPGAGIKSGTQWQKPIKPINLLAASTLLCHQGVQLFLPVVA
jgi:hypothetical protein